MKGFGGLFDHDLVTKVVCFSVDGAATFQGIKIGVATQLIKKSSPFCILVHCIVHRTNLVVLTLSDLLIVVKIETLLVGVYKYFNHNPKRNLEKSKLVGVMETKGLKILCNIKTNWINMVVPSKVVLEKFKTLLVKLAKHVIVIESAIVNYELLCDIEIVLGFTCLLPMLEALHGLSKYVQNIKTFICDFVGNVKLCQVDLHNMYCDV